MQLGVRAQFSWPEFLLFNVPCFKSAHTVLQQKRQNPLSFQKTIGDFVSLWIFVSTTRKTTTWSVVFTHAARHELAEKKEKLYYNNKVRNATYNREPTSTEPATLSMFVNSGGETGVQLAQTNQICI